MRIKLLLNYVYIFGLSILSQSPSSCLTQTSNLVISSSDGQVHGNEERTAVEPKQHEERINDETNQRIPHDQLVDKQTHDTVHPVRRRRDLRDGGSSSYPSKQTGLTSEQRFKKSNLRIDRNVGKLTSKKNNVKISGANEGMSDSQDPVNLDDHDEQKEAKRSSYSSEAVKITRPKSRAIKRSDLAAKTSLTKEKLNFRDSGGYASFGNDAEAQKSESRNKRLDGDVYLDDKSTEYEESSDDEEEPELAAGNVGYKEDDSELSGTDEESDDLERQEIVRREAGVADGEYEDFENQGETCEDASLIHEPNYQQSKIRSEAGLFGKKDNAATPNEIEAEKQRGKSIDNSENVNEVSSDNAKRELAETAIAESPGSSFRIRGQKSKREASTEILGNNDTVDRAVPAFQKSNEDSNANSEREAGIRQNVQRNNKDTSDISKLSDVKYIDKKETESQESSLNANTKDDKLNSNLQRNIEEQIQQRIESIKEEIKRQIEEKERIQEIEANNAKYDEIQNGIDEDEVEDEDVPIPDTSNEQKSILKRSIIDEIRSPHVKAKRHILRRVKRSDTTDARQLQAVEGVEKLDPDVFVKAQFRHESIRKRSAPIYGAVDKDVPDVSKPLIERSVAPRRVYLVNNEQKRSPTSTGKEIRNTVIMPEELHVNVRDELPSGLSLDPSTLEESSSSSSSGNYRLTRSLDRFLRRRQASAVIPEGRVAFLGNRPQVDDENDEGSEFDDDGFEDRTSNLQRENSYAVPRVLTHDEYRGNDPRDGSPANFLFAGADHGRNELLVRRRRGGIREEEEPAPLHSGGAVARRQTLARVKQMQSAKIASRKDLVDRNKRQTENGLRASKCDSVASLVESSQELSPRLATEYKEAFGGLQNDPGGAFARFKRVKRHVLPTTLDN